MGLQRDSAATVIAHEAASLPKCKSENLARNDRCLLVQIAGTPGRHVCPFYHSPTPTQCRDLSLDKNSSLVHVHELGNTEAIYERRYLSVGIPPHGTSTYVVGCWCAAKIFHLPTRMVNEGPSFRYLLSVYLNESPTCESLLRREYLRGHQLYFWDTPSLLKFGVRSISNPTQAVLFIDPWYAEFLRSKVRLTQFLESS